MARSSPFGLKHEDSTTTIILSSYHTWANRSLYLCRNYESAETSYKTSQMHISATIDDSEEAVNVILPRLPALHITVSPDRPSGKRTGAYNERQTDCSSESVRSVGILAISRSSSSLCPDDHEEFELASDFISPEHTYTAINRS